MSRRRKLIPLTIPKALEMAPVKTCPRYLKNPIPPIYRSLEAPGIVTFKA